MKNRFHVLAVIPEDRINTLRENMKKIFFDTSKDTIGTRRRVKKEGISEIIWQLTEGIWAAKYRMLRGDKEETALRYLQGDKQDCQEE